MIILKDDNNEGFSGLGNAVLGVVGVVGGWAIAASMDYSVLGFIVGGGVFLGAFGRMSFDDDDSEDKE